MMRGGEGTRKLQDWAGEWGLFTSVEGAGIFGIQAKSELVKYE